MKMFENFSEIITSLENLLNSLLKKKVAGDHYSISSNPKTLADNTIEFYAAQPRKATQEDPLKRHP